MFSTTSPPTTFSLDQTVCPPRPAVGASATGYLVAYRRLCESSDGFDGVVARLVQPDGLPIGPRFEAAATVATGSAIPGRVAVASDGGGYLVAWDTRNASDTASTIRGIRFDAAGTPSPAQDFELAPLGLSPGLVFTGGDYLMIMQRNDPATGADVIAVPISAAGVVGADIDVARTTRRDGAPSIACTASGCLAAWIAGNSEVRVARITGGTVLDPGGKVIANAPGIERHTHTIFDGSTFVVGWRAGDQFFVAHVTPDGSVALPAAPIPATATPYATVAIASNGIDTMVAYDRYDATNGYNVRRVRVRSTTPLAAPRPLDAGVDPPPPDASDAPPPDASPDAPPPDASPDAPPPDASPDAPPPDASPDAPPPDASPDAPPPDASPDAPPPDASPDAAAAPDAPDRVPPHGGGGCSTTRAAGGPLALVIALWLGRRRRRCSRRAR